MVAAQQPQLIGALESTAPIMAGWACRRNSNASVDLEIYVGDRNDDGVRIAKLRAALQRADLAVGASASACVCAPRRVCERGFQLAWTDVPLARRFVDQVIRLELWSAADGSAGGAVGERLGAPTMFNLSAALLGAAGTTLETTTAGFFPPATPAATPEGNTNIIYAGAAGGVVLLFIVSVVIVLRCRKGKKQAAAEASAEAAAAPQHALTGQSARPATPIKVADDLASLEQWQAEAIAKRELPRAPGQKPKIVYDEDDAAPPRPPVTYDAVQDAIPSYDRVF